MRRRTIFRYAYHLLLLHSSVIISNFDVFDAIIRPHKTNAELIVNPYAVLTLPIILKGFQNIPWWNFQRLQGNYAIQLIEFSLCHSPDLLRTGRRASLVFFLSKISSVPLSRNDFITRHPHRLNSSLRKIITDNVIYGNSYFAVYFSVTIGIFGVFS